MRPLFRAEALAAQQTQWLGRVQLARPIPLDVLTIVIVVLAMAVAAFLGLAHYTRKATVAGALVPDLGLIRLVPTDSGTVVERHVREGQSVRAGDVLFVLALERARLPAAAQSEVRRSLAGRERSLRDAARQQHSLAASQRTTLERRLAAIGAEQGHLDTEAALLRQRLALAEQSRARLEALSREQFISDAQVQLKHEEVLGLQAQVQALVRQGSVLARERSQIEGELRALPLQAGSIQGDIERDLAELARETAEQETERRLVVRAPQDGQVSALLAEPGQAVSPGSALATLVPRGAVLQAHLFAPSRAVGFLRPGLPVRLRLDAYPYQKFGHLEGTVRSVSTAPLAGGELAGLGLGLGRARGEEATEPLFRITVDLARESAPAGWPGPLAAGMRLQGDVMLERRRLVEWLFEPLLGLGARL